MNSEFYTGWLTHWSEPQMAKVDKGAIISSLGDMLDSNVNVNFYMFCGGTNFEFYAGKIICLINLYIEHQNEDEWFCENKRSERRNVKMNGEV